MTDHQPSCQDCDTFEPESDQIALITKVSAAVARRGRLRPDDALDFCQHVQMKFLETRYEVLRRFDGRSSLKTYLVVVIGRLLLDWRRRESGRWRASAEAARLGVHAVALERLIARDGYSSNEAVELVAAQPGAPSQTELWRTVPVLPCRPGRRMIEAGAEDAAVAPFDAVAALEDDEAKKRTWRAVLAAVRQLPPADRRLLDLRFRQGQQMPAIAEALGDQPKRLYSRCSQILRRLRETIEATAAISPTRERVRRRAVPAR